MLADDILVLEDGQATDIMAQDGLNPILLPTLVLTQSQEVTANDTRSAMKRLLKGLASRPWLMMLALLSTQSRPVSFLSTRSDWSAIDWIGTGQAQVLQDGWSNVSAYLTIAFQWLNPWLYNQLVWRPYGRAKTEGHGPISGKSGACP